MTLTLEQLEELGSIADSADNFAGAAKLPMPDSVHKPQLERGLEQISARIKNLYTTVSNENPWQH